MARAYGNSGNGTTSGINGSRVFVDYNVASQSQAGNYTDIDWAVGIDYGDPDYWHNVSDGLLVFDRLGDATGGTTVWSAPGFFYGTSNPGNGGGLHYFASGTFRVNHFADGTARAAFYAEIHCHSDSYVSSVYHEFDLPTIATLPSAPGTPSVSGHTDSDPTTATLSWTAPTNVGTGLTQRQVQIDNSSGFGSPLIDSTASWGTSYNASGLAKGTTYYARVRAATSAGWGPWSGTRTFTTGTTTPSAPSQPTVSSISSTTAVVSWSAPSDSGGTSITGYDVQRATDSGFTQNVATVQDSASPNTLTGLLPATGYWVRVRAKNNQGTGPYSTARQFTTGSRVKVGNGSSWRDARVYVGNGSAWVPAVPHLGNGSAWV